MFTFNIAIAQPDLLWEKTFDGGLSDDGKERMAALDAKYANVINANPANYETMMPKEKKQFDKDKEK